LDWSLHYLSGQRVHHGLSGRVGEVCDDPLLGETAHGHQRNLVEGLHLSQGLRSLEGLSGDGIRVLGLHPPIRSASHFRSWLEIVRGRGHEVICVEGPEDWMWRFGGRYRGKGCHRMRYGREECLRMALSSARDRARLQRLVGTPGGLREHLALGFGSGGPCAGSQSQGGRAFRVVQFREWLENSEVAVLGLMHGLGLPVCQERLRLWRAVADRWRGIVGSRLQEWEGWWRSMVEAVISGQDHHCGELNMMQEGMLVRDVLRSSGRMIRARHLERLPHNARDIHQLIR